MTFDSAGWAGGNPVALPPPPPPPDALPPPLHTAARPPQRRMAQVPDLSQRPENLHQRLTSPDDEEVGASHLAAGPRCLHTIFTPHSLPGRPLASCISATKMYYR